MQVLRAQLPRWAQKLFWVARYKVFWGGRGAARSWSFARAILILGSQRKLRVLCCREFQKSIADSVHKLFQDQIELLQLKGWQVQKTSIIHVGTGTEILFEGLRYNVNRIKSLEGIDICWVEEAESVSSDSWQVLIPTIRKPGSEIWISFNPDLADDPTYVRFVVNKPPNAIVEKVGWEDNPWFSDELREEKDFLYAVDRDAAEHVWGGEPRRWSQAQVLFGKWRREAFELDRTWIGPFYGLDFGFGSDALAATESWIRQEKGPQPRKFAIQSLYIRREVWKLHLDNHLITKELYKVFGSIMARHTIRADNSRPETISYLKQHGLGRIAPAMKWPGSVEDGISYLRNFAEIIIHPDCPHTIEEAKLWSYKVDKQTNEVLPDLVDKHNHTWDATRYGHQPAIRANKGIPAHRYSGRSYSNA